MDETRTRRRPGRGWWAGAIALSLILGIAVGVGLDLARAGSISLWLAGHGWLGPYDAAGTRVSIGERSLYLDCRGSGSQTVILEAGNGGDAGGWGAVLPDVAGFTRVCAYDRANQGRSDPRGTHTVGEAVDDLAALLEAAGERPPYVLVGHSLGGVYVRVYAATRPADVAGIVLVDAFNPDLFGRLTGVVPSEIAAAWSADMEASFALIERTERLDWPASARQLAGASVAGLPLEILVAPRTADPRLMPQQRDAVEEAWLAGLRSLSPDARITVVEGTGHLIQLDRPDEVIAAIRRLVERGRAGGASE